MSREQVKELSGFSDRQLTQATRVATIPEKKFEALVEGEKPPAISALAKQGTKSRENIVDLQGRDPNVNPDVNVMSREQKRRAPASFLAAMQHKLT